MTIYAGNLSRDVKENDLREAFRVFGQVASVNIAKTRYNNASKGFAFIEMPVQSEAEAAIAGLHRKDFKGRTLDLIESQPRSRGKRQ